MFVEIIQYALGHCVYLVVYSKKKKTEITGFLDREILKYVK